MSSSTVDQIKQRLSVADVVGSYIKIQKAGANFRACCPFHNEKTPSFYVSPSREIWHCFGCGAGGDLFEFVKRIEGIDFPEALKVLADRAGVQIVHQNPKLYNEKTKLLELMKEAVLFYQKKLTENKEALNYLWDRGLKNETLKNFNIGFSPEEDGGSWRNLFYHLKNKGYTGQEMEKAGLVIKKSSEDFYDRFRGRIMFPLKDASGRFVGFSGRIFNEVKKDVGKYINTPQTILYDKSKILYGFDRAKVEITKEDSCVLVEGQMDVLMSHQSGIENTVAVSGTALTEGHLSIIHRLTNNIIMAFDSDEAGESAAKRSIDISLQEGFEVEAISLPEDEDPADVILKDKEKWKGLVENSVHIIEFYLTVLRSRYKDERKFKLAVEKSVLPYILFIQSGVDRSHWVKEISNRLGVKEEVILEELRKINRNKKDIVGAQKKENNNIKTKKELLKEKLAGIFLWKKEKIELPEMVLKEIKEFTKNLKEENKNKIILEAELFYGEDTGLKKEVENLSKELKTEITKEKLNNLAEEVRGLEAKGESEKLEKKLEEFQTLSRELAGI